MLTQESEQYRSKENERSGVAIVRHSQVKQKLQVSSAKLYDMVATGSFPKPFKLIPGGRAKGWLEADVDHWIVSRKNDVEGSVK